MGVCAARVPVTVVVAVAPSSVSELTLDALTVAVAVSVPGLVALTMLIVIRRALKPSKASNGAVDRPALLRAGRPGVRGTGFRDERAAVRQQIADRHARRVVCSPYWCR